MYHLFCGSEEEAAFKENQKKMLTEGSVWQQSSKLMEMAQPPKTAPAKAEAAGQSAAKDDAEKKDTSRMRALVSSLKQ